MSTARPALVGLAGSHLQASEREGLERLRPAGILLFARNAVHRDQLLELVHDVRAVLAAVGVHHAVVAVDQEGGAVAPLDRVVAAGLGAASLGWIDDRAFTHAVHRERARALRELGVDLVLAPVADVDRPGNPVIATRAFGTESSIVAAHVAAAVSGLREGGVRTCAKHWPGHGSPRLDSHLDLPTLDLDETTRLAIDAPPFAAAVRAGVDSLMLAHLHVPAWSPGAPVPLGVDPAVVRRLRHETGFTGPLLSDAVEMRGWAGRRPLELVEAGVDLVLFARSVATLGVECAELPERPLVWASALEPDLAAPHGSSTRPDEVPTRIFGDVRAWHAAQRVWVVDAASEDRLLRLPVEGADPLEGGRALDPSVWMGLMPAAKTHVLLRSSLRLDETAPWEADDALVVLAARPLDRAVEAWIAAGRRPGAVLRFGAVALHRETVGTGGFELLCPEIRPESLARVLRAL